MTRHLIALAVVLQASVASAQTPQQQPLVQQSNLVYLGSFNLPNNDGQPASGENNKYTYSEGALSIGPDGSLYLVCHVNGNKMSRVSIPAIGGTATVITPCQPVTGLGAIDPDTVETKRVSGSLYWNGRVIVAAHTYYDGSGNAAASHFTAQTNLTGFAGPYRLSTANPGWVGGPQGVIPSEWRTLLGGPAFAALCCVSVLSRTSYGPDFTVYNPDDLGVVTPIAPGKTLLGYPGNHQLAAWNSANPLFHGATKIGGAAFVGGTRSVLFFGRHGDNWCYGDGDTQCGDPFLTGQGNHSFPYRHQVWAYDANDLLAVKQGTKQMWEVQPYGVWTIADLGVPGYRDMRGITYDDTTKRVYAMASLDSAVPPKVHVWSITVPQSAPIDATYGPWGAFVPISEWTACDATGSRTRAIRRTREELTPAQNGGAIQPTFENSEEVDATCAVDAVLSDWGEWALVGAWGACTQTGGAWTQAGTEQRTRTVLTPAINGGTTGALSEERPVSQSCTPPPVDYTCTVQSVIVVGAVQVTQSTCGPVIDAAAIPVGTQWTVSVPRP